MDELREEWEEGGRESWREREMEGGRLTTLLELEGTWTESFPKCSGPELKLDEGSLGKRNLYSLGKHQLNT